VTLVNNRDLASDGRNGETDREREPSSDAADLAQWRVPVDRPEMDVAADIQRADPDVSRVEEARVSAIDCEGAHARMRTTSVQVRAPRPRFSASGFYAVGHL